jgi:regulator of sigma E protease
MEHIQPFVTQIQSLLHYAIPFIIVISVVVFVHEFGHYWVARRCGVKVEQFSIGFGRELFGWNDAHGTRWKVSLLPLGGYVKMYGDAGPASNADASVAAMTDEQKKVSFHHQPVGKRFAIVVAGPLFNYLFAALVLTLLFMEPPFGLQMPPMLCHMPAVTADTPKDVTANDNCFLFQGQHYTTPTVSTVLPDSAAAQAGILAGDKILTLDGATINRFEDVRTTVMFNAGTPIIAEIERAGVHMNVTVTPKIEAITDRFGGVHKLGRIGITSDKVLYKRWPLHLAIGHAVGEAYSLSASTIRSIGQMIMGLRGTEELGGPLRIAAMSGHVAEDGPPALVLFMAMISINLGLINLFPVPLLDGGHLLYYIAEKLRGRPLHEKIQEFGMRIGMALILCLMVFSTWNDLVQLKIVSFIRNIFS